MKNYAGQSSSPQAPRKAPTQDEEATTEAGATGVEPQRLVTGFSQAETARSRPTRATQYLPKYPMPLSPNTRPPQPNVVPPEHNTFGRVDGHARHKNRGHVWWAENNGLECTEKCCG